MPYSKRITAAAFRADYAISKAVTKAVEEGERRRKLANATSTTKELEDWEYKIYNKWTWWIGGNYGVIVRRIFAVREI